MPFTASEPPWENSQLHAYHSNATPASQGRDQKTLPLEGPPAPPPVVTLGLPVLRRPQKYNVKVVSALLATRLPSLLVEYPQVT